MSGRLLNRKWGRVLSSPVAQSTTHVIKIGFDKREPNAKNPVPGKYNGFVICRDRIGDDGNLQVDNAIMARLVKGWSPQMLAEARRLGDKAPDSLLPKTLRFIMMHDAVRDPAGFWRYPDVAHEALENWDGVGLNCHGDGVTAYRRDPKVAGARSVLTCNPIGKPGVAPENVCPISASGACKQHLRLLLCLWVEGADGNPAPLCPDLGWEARFRLDTSSGYAGLRLMSALDAAADRVKGRLHWITGAVSFAKLKKRHATGVGLTQQLMFAVSEIGLQRREADLRLAEGRVIGTDAAPSLLTTDAAPPPAAPVIVPPPPPPPATIEEAISTSASQAHREPPSLDERVCQAELETLVGILSAAVDWFISHDGLDEQTAWARAATIKRRSGDFLPDAPSWFFDGEDDERQARRFDALCALVVRAINEAPELARLLDAPPASWSQATGAVDGDAQQPTETDAQGAEGDF